MQSNPSKPAPGVAAEFQDITITVAVDGSPQRYMQWLPPDFAGGRSHDLAIGLHGHGSDRTQFAQNPRAECAAFRDFALAHNMIAVSPDYRATTSWMGPLAEADLVQIIALLKSQQRIGRVFLVGGSMGAASALTFAALHPEMVDGVTAMNGLANHLEYQQFQEAIAESFGGGKEEISDEYRKRSAEFWPQHLTMPIAFTVGGDDALVPPASVLRLAEMLTQLQRPVLMINRPQGGHATNYEDALAAMEFMAAKR